MDGRAIADLLSALLRSVAGRSTGSGWRGQSQWLRLAHQSLQRPRTAAFDAGRHVRQWNERPELSAATEKGERRDVMLNPVVVRRERSCPSEIDRPVGP